MRKLILILLWLALPLASFGADAMKPINATTITLYSQDLAQRTALNRARVDGFVSAGGTAGVGNIALQGATSNTLSFTTPQSVTVGNAATATTATVALTALASSGNSETATTATTALNSQRLGSQLPAYYATAAYAAATSTTAANHIANVSNPHSVTKAQVGLANVLNVAQEPAIAAGTTAQYWRGDKAWATLNQAAVAGLTIADSPQFANVNLAAGGALRLWGSSDDYRIKMSDVAEHQYGPVTSYSIKSYMTGAAGRGWTWGQNGVTPIAALDIAGNYKAAGYGDFASLKIGGTERISNAGAATFTTIGGSDITASGQFKSTKALADSSAAANAKFLSYYIGSENWSGIGNDSGGNMWFRSGLSGAGYRWQFEANGWTLFPSIGPDGLRWRLAEGAGDDDLYWQVNTTTKFKMSDGGDFSLYGDLYTGAVRRLEQDGDFSGKWGMFSDQVSTTNTVRAGGNINSTGGALQTNSTTRIENDGDAILNWASVTGNLDTSGTMRQGGKTTLYNNVATEGMGLAPIRDYVALTDQSASITATACTNTNTAGLYRVSYYMVVTTTDGGAGTVTCAIEWNDGADDRSHGPAAALDMTATEETSDSVVVYLPSTTGITYSTTVAGTPGAARYTLVVTAEKLGP